MDGFAGGFVHGRESEAVFTSVYQLYPQKRFSKGRQGGYL